MSGYRWHPIFKLIPDNGAETTVDLWDQIPGTTGPVRIDLQYREDQDEWQDIDRVIRSQVFGFRVAVRMDFDITDMQEHQVLANITNALADESTQVQLSLDAGFVFRAVKLDRAPRPRPLNGKTFAGASFRLDLSCTELLDELPALVEGAW